MDEYTETAAPLGSAEAAVLSCVRLISAVTCQPEKLCAYYLDLYYQVRRAYERENESEKPEALTLEECWPRLRELIEEKLRGAAGEILTEMGLRPGDEYPAPPRATNRPEAVAPSTAEAAPPQSPQAAGGGGEDEELRAKRLRAMEAARKAAATVDRKGKKNPNAMAAAEKRRIRARFMEARQKGDAPTAVLLKACPTLTDGDVWRIVNGHNVGIEIYRLLESALDQIENSITKDDE